MPTKTYTLTHWGTYRTQANSGGAPDIHPLDGDPAPSPIGQSLRGTLNDSARITQPMVRAGYLRDGPASNTRRGGEPFVPVDWETATKLVAQESNTATALFSAALTAGPAPGGSTIRKVSCIAS